MELEKTLQDLEKFDFTSNEEFDLENIYKAVNTKRVEKEELKNKEAENIILKLGPKYVSEEVLDQFNIKKENFHNFIRKFSADTELVKNMSNEVGGERDKIYEVGVYLFNLFSEYLKKLRYNIEFSYDEFDFIVKTIRQKLEYDSNEVFQVIKLETDFLADAELDFKKLKNSDSFQVNIDINNIVLLYHLISKYKVKGINKQFELYASILNKIGESNQVFNSLNIINERLNQDLQLWTNSITPDALIAAPETETKAVE